MESPTGFDWRESLMLERTHSRLPILLEEEIFELDLGIP